MQLQFLTHVDPLAVCFDGSPAGYYWKPSPTGSNVWIVHLAGGGWCYNERTCQQRCNDPQTPLCSSRTWPPMYLFSGVFSPSEDSLLQDANMAYVGYCTCDAHMGDAETFGRQFRGARVVKAVIRDMQQHGLGTHDDRRDILVFGGASAGGRGAMVHLEYLPELLGSAARNVDVLGFLDSPLWIDIPSPSFSSFPGFAPQCKAAYENFNISHLGYTCVDAYPRADHWKCLMGQYRMPFIARAYLLVASSFDSYQLENILGHRPQSQEEEEFAMEFARRTVALVTELFFSWPLNATHSNAVFSWACYNHAMSISPAGFDGYMCGPWAVTMDAALQQFLGLAPVISSRPFGWIERCEGFDCGAGCSVMNVDHSAATLYA